MAFFLYASFPNSRIKPRGPTTTADTPVVTVGAGQTVMILPQDANRTYANLRNLDSTIDVFYGYSPSIDGTPANGGDLLQALEEVNGLATPGPIYVHNPGASAINIGVDVGRG